MPVQPVVVLLGGTTHTRGTNVVVVILAFYGLKISNEFLPPPQRTRCSPGANRGKWNAVGWGNGSDVWWTGEVVGFKRMPREMRHDSLGVDKKLESGAV